MKKAIFQKYSSKMITYFHFLTLKKMLNKNSAAKPRFKNMSPIYIEIFSLNSDTERGKLLLL